MPVQEAAEEASGGNENEMQPYQDPAVAQTSVAVGALLFRMGLGLLFVLGLIYLTAFALRTYGRSNSGLPTSGRPMRLLQTLPLGPGRGVHLVAVGKRALLLSSSGSQVNLLMEVPPEEAEELVKSLEAAGLAGLSHITHRFRAASERGERESVANRYLKFRGKE